MHATVHTCARACVHAPTYDACVRAFVVAMRAALYPCTSACMRVWLQRCLHVPVHGYVWAPKQNRKIQKQQLIYIYIYIYMFVCVCACMRACMKPRVRVCPHVAAA